MTEDRKEIAGIVSRLTDIRAQLLCDYPFYGSLILHLTPGLADCGTAYTDMKSIVFDPEFLRILSDTEVKFVMLHEVMHCVLKHCVRCNTLDPRLFNIACDIVVNSLILETLGIREFNVAGEKAMHIAPDGREGRFYTAEQVYEMLVKKEKDSGGNLKQENGFDRHEPWTETEGSASILSDIWEANLRKASKLAGDGTGIPAGIRRYLKDIVYMSKTNWRRVLADFIKHDRSDFTFERRDARYQGDFIMPLFCEDMFGEKAENLWFLIDVSGSISEVELSMAYKEIKSACSQMDSLSGMLSFFDTEVSEPQSFDSVEALDKIEPVGGGGTSFHAIFDYLGSYFNKDELPAYIIIITDGYAEFPGEDAALGIPVLWCIVDSGIEPPWGNAIFISENG